MGLNISGLVIDKNYKNNIIASICITISILIYLKFYVAMANSHPSSRGLVEYFTLVSSVLFIVNGLCLATIFKNKTKTTLSIFLIIYFLIGIIPMLLAGYFNTITTGIISIIILMISLKLITTSSWKKTITLNVIILTLNCIWGWAMFEMLN